MVLRSKTYNPLVKNREWHIVAFYNLIITPLTILHVVAGELSSFLVSKTTKPFTNSRSVLFSRSSGMGLSGSIRDLLFARHQLFMAHRVLASVFSGTTPQAAFFLSGEVYYSKLTKLQWFLWYTHSSTTSLAILTRANQAQNPPRFLSTKHYNFLHFLQQQT